MYRLPTVIALLALVACGSTEPADEFKGAYNLTTVNGQPLPYTTVVSNIRSTTAYGLLIITPQGEWSMVTSGTTQIGTQSPIANQEIVNGTWSAAGNTLTLLSYDPPEVRTGTYSARTITMNLAVYKRQ